MTQISIRIDDELKRDAEAVLDEIGISLSAAVTVFLKKVARERRIPFELTAAAPAARATMAAQTSMAARASLSARTSPAADGLCFLTEKEALWAGMLSDVLKKEGVPFITKNALGAGMALKVGPMSERVRFYVPESRLEDAENIVAGLFSEEVDGGEK